MLLSVATILYLSRDFWFYGDELDWLSYGRDFELRTLLTPHGSHLIAIPRLVYEAFPRLFGVDYLPFRLLTVLAVLSIGGLFFLLIRERVGALLALAPTVVLLFFGSASDIVLTPLGIPFLLSTAFGLAALLLVETAPRWWQPMSCALLILSVLSHTFGVIFAGTLLVYLVLTPSQRRGLWAAVVPIVGWVIWWRWSAQFDQSIADGGNVLGAPAFALEAFAAAIQAATGFGPYFGNLDIIADIAKVAFLFVAVAAIAGIVFRAVAGLATPWLWSYLALGFGFWLAIGLAEGPGRQPDESRYLLFGAIVVFLIAAEALRDVRVPDRWGRGVVYAGTALALIAIVGNAARAVALAPGIEEAGVGTRAQMTSTRIAAEIVDPASSIQSLGLPASPYAAAPVGWLLDFEDASGHLGYSIEELSRQAEEVKAGADYVLAKQEGIQMRIVDPGEIRGLSCSKVEPASDGYSQIDLLDGFNFLQAIGSSDRGEVPAGLGRFAYAASVELGSLPSGDASVAGGILVPADTAEQPWFVTIPGAVRVCRPL